MRSVFPHRSSPNPKRSHPSAACFGLALLSLGAIWAVPESAYSAGEPQGQLAVHVETGGRVRLEARQAPMPQLIEAIAAKTGTRIHYQARPGALVTASCAGSEAKPLLRCLLGADANMMVRYERGAPAEIWVLATGTEEGGDAAALATQSAAAARPTTSGTAGSPDIGRLLAQAHDPSAGRRADALVRLVADERVDAGTLRQTLEAAFADEDAEVRAQAVFGLAQQGGDEAPRWLRAALNDPDESVRLMAVDSAGGDAQSLALLREALADQDDTVRELAALKLEPANADPVP